MFTTTMTNQRRPFARRAGIAVLSLLALALAGEPAAAGVFPAHSGGMGGGEAPEIIKVSGGRKAAFAIIGGIAALGVGAAIASQNRRQDYGYGGGGGYGYGGGYAPSYEPEPSYALEPYYPQPRTYYAPSAAYEPDEPYYAPTPPPVYYPDYRYGGPDDTVYRSPYSRHGTRLLREGN
jgi:hypothetical protein